MSRKVRRLFFLFAVVLMTAAALVPPAPTPASAAQICRCSNDSDCFSCCPSSLGYCGSSGYCGCPV